MYDLMIYSLKVGVCLAVFYLFFKLLLSRETFHRFNRIVVLGAMLLSFVLPLCVITVYREIPVLPEIPEGEAVTTAFAEPLPEPFPWETLAGAAFLLGAAATLLWTLCSLAGVLRLIRCGSRERLEDGAVLVRTERPVTPFSWGRYIVMSERDLAENGDAILLHERAHLRLRHSFDLIVTDVAGCLQWFNPAMWLLRRELRAIHEYEADEAVLDSGVDARSYQMLLIKKAAGGRWYSVANSFNHSKLKNRITMMLRKKSSRWAGARALLLLPLTAVALGAFAETAYVFPQESLSDETVLVPLPEDKIKKENRTVVIRSGKSTKNLMEKALILVDGREVTTLDSLDPGRIESISVLKDSTSKVVYGEKGKDGVILVTLKKEGGQNPEKSGSTKTAAVSSATGQVVTLNGIDGLEGTVVSVTTGADQPDDVRVIGYGLKSGNRSADSAKTVVISGKSNLSGIRTTGSLKGNPIILVDGVQVFSGLESIDPEQIQSVSVIKDSMTPEMYKAQGFDAVIMITTKRAAAAQKAAAKSAREGIEAGRAGIEAAREGMEYARKYMDSDAWKQAQKALDKAQKELEAARKETSAQLSEAQKAVGTSLKLSADAGHADRVTIHGTPESSVSVYKGQVTLKGGFPDGMLIRINGREASKKDVERLKPGRIKRMEVYKGDEAVKRYGEKGRNGVVEIRARR